MYTPKEAFISFGDQAKMYTLYVVYSVSESGNNSAHNSEYTSYIKNLSCDPKKAMLKAALYAAQHNISVVHTKAVETPLNEIQRIKKSEKERIERENKEKSENKEREILNEIVSLYHDQYDSEQFVFGKYYGKTFAEVKRINHDYIRFICETFPKKENPRSIKDLCINSVHEFFKYNPISVKEAKESTSEYVGLLGERREFTVTVKKKLPIETIFGYSVLYIFEDSEGNVLKSFYSGKKSMGVEGEVVNIKGSIDKHELYGNVKQTILKRIVRT